jgi:hypothetical protein
MCAPSNSPYFASNTNFTNPFVLALCFADTMCFATGYWQKQCAHFLQTEDLENAGTEKSG